MLGFVKKVVNKIRKGVRSVGIKIKAIVEDVQDIKIKESTKGVLLITSGVVLIGAGVACMVIGNITLKNSGEIDSLNRAIEVQRLEKMLMY